MSVRMVATTLAPKAQGPYSQAIECDGLLYCSGQVALDPETGKLIEGGIQEQTERVLKTLSFILTTGGSDLNHVLKVSVFLADISHFREMNEVYGRFFENHKPARTTVQAGALPLPGALVEIDAIARVVR
ncbi:MAG: reactive intermediate/imine deaminase [Candidatus Omnitrophica bacterium]|nr:2-iminobutanoate/2-iminopropanoate deaminase [bacterium]NUN97198.1 reactive intermediate/imine deaminase [Candidatus Omnitrophota bacterium]